MNEEDVIETTPTTRTYKLTFSEFVDEFANCGPTEVTCEGPKYVHFVTEDGKKVGAFLNHSGYVEWEETV